MDTCTRINIKDIKGDPDGGELRGFYFEETSPGSGEFHLFAPDDTLIETEPSPIPNNTPFTFTIHRKLDWSLTLDYSDAKQHGHGKWSAHHAKSFGKIHPSIGYDDPETGTFQAQGGLGTGDDLSASASASA